MQGFSSGQGGGIGGVNTGSAFGVPFNLMSLLNGPNAAGAGMPYLNQIGPMLDKYLSPYINAGQGAMGALQSQYGQLMSNPGGVMNQIGSGFQQSPGYQFQVNQATGAANRAAAAGGMLGSPQEQQNLAGTVNGMANQDYYNYLSHALGMYGQGLNGMQDINHMGFNASQDMTHGLYDMYSSMANMGYAGQNAQNQQNGQMLGGLMSMASFL